MSYSPEFFKDFQALQGAIEPLVKDCTNPHYKSSYADINSVLFGIKEACTANNFIFLQYPYLVPLATGAVVNTLTTEIVHTDGTVIKGSIELACKDKGDPQKLGGALTYMRRYSLITMLNLEAYDDDGEEPAKTPKKPKTDGSKKTRIQKAVDDTDEDLASTGSSWKEFAKYLKAEGVETKAQLEAICAELDIDGEDSKNVGKCLRDTKKMDKAIAAVIGEDDDDDEDEDEDE